MAEQERISHVTAADDAIIQNLLWLLMERGIVSKSDILLMLEGCIGSLQEAPNPNERAILHLQQIGANFERAGRSDQ